MNEVKKDESVTTAPPGASPAAKTFSERVLAGVNSEASAGGSRRSVKFGFDRVSGLYVLAAIILVFGLWVPETFLTTQTLKSVASQQAVVAVLALALLTPLAAGIFDLS